MKISRTHKRFADHLDDQTALEYPERFLGPNWKDVLNFWIYYDTLSDDVLRLIIRRHQAIEDLNYVKNLSWNAAENTIGEYYTRVAYDVTHSLSYLTCELIGSHKLETLNFLPLFLNL
jgi:hypothetical protein